MEKFRKILESQDSQKIEEASMSAIERNLQTSIQNIEKTNLRTLKGWVTKELGSGYSKDFDKAEKYLNEAAFILKDILKDVQSNY